MLKLHNNCLTSPYKVISSLCGEVLMEHGIATLNLEGEH